MYELISSDTFLIMYLNFIVLGVSTVNIDLPSQTVVVESTTDAQTLLDAINKTG